MMREMATVRLPLLDPEAARVPVAPFQRLATLWIQVTGTWCNLECVHCLNASGPGHPWLRPLRADVVRNAIREGERLGVKDIYFTGGEPFLHGHLLDLLACSLAAAPTTVLTNGTLIDEARADALASLASSSRYSLEVRISLDDVDPDANDRIRGDGAWARAVRAIRLLDARGLLPIVSATEIVVDGAGGGLYERFRDFLLGIGVTRPRVKIIPVFAAGRLARDGGDTLTDAALEGFDRTRLQCAETRVVAADGVYACPILAGQRGARLSRGNLAEAFGAARLYHPACGTCVETGMTCRNA
jgi:MoaA/NifB/PqqE/SkfB family radical SAM enzyme